MNKLRFAHVNAGSATLLVIFTTLCLAIFGVLSAASAHADRKLSAKLSDSVQGYYAADTKAQQILVEIDGCLYDIRRGIAAGDYTQADFSQLVFDKLQNLNGAALDVSDGVDGLTVCYQVEKGANDYLQVRLSILQNPAGGKRYTIREYRIVPKEQEETEEKNLDLWDGTVPA